MAWAAAIHCVTFYCFQEVTRRAGAVFFAQFNYLVVAAGIFWALIIFDEMLSLWVWGALACMVVGVWLVNTGARRRTAAASSRRGRRLVTRAEGSGASRCAGACYNRQPIANPEANGARDLLRLSVIPGRALRRRAPSDCS